MSVRRAGALPVPRSGSWNSEHTPVEVETCEGVSSIPLLAEEWDALVDRVGGGPFLRSEWIDAWWRAFGAGQLELLIARKAGRLVGIAPLYRRHGAIRSVSNWHTPTFGFLSEDAETESALAETSVARTRRRFPFSNGKEARSRGAWPRAKPPGFVSSRARCCGHRISRSRATGKATSEV
jgi:CelD/BcsL family acetyltransferase involved in cellulose biosynthesis